MSTPRRRTGVGVALLATAALMAGCSSTNAPGGGGSGGSEADAPNNLQADIAAGEVGVVSDLSQIGDLCEGAEGEPLSVGVVDGFGLNSWSQTVKAEIEAEAADCAGISGVEYVAGRGDLDATSSAITSLAAKGTDIVLVVPTAGPGEAHLPAIRTATQSGAFVVPFASDPEGTAGTDYLDYADQSPPFVGRSWAQWVVDQLGEEGGNVVFLGGPAGAAVSAQEFEGVQEVLADNPQVNLLTPEPVTTNWDPAEAQRAMAGLIASNPDIDAVIADYGAVAAGVIRAYEAVGESVPLLTSTDDNSLSCGFDELKADNPDYELATVSSRTWIGRVALRKAFAAATGQSLDEPSIYDLSLFEDSTGSTEGAVAPSEACLPDAPSDATPSSQLSVEELSAVFD